MLRLIVERIVRMRKRGVTARRRSVIFKFEASGFIRFLNCFAHTAFTKRTSSTSVQGGKVMIVDENTGRLMPGRRWSNGLHQAVEAKEGVAIEKETKTYATITIQNYFRMYDKLAGMTGTAETEAGEFHDIYRLGVMVIPTHRDCIRKDLNDLMFKGRRQKFNQVLEDLTEANQKGQPVLVGTASVESSEVFSRMLKRANIRHTVLNAKFHEREAEIVAQAGQRGAVTIATNMAGRGTDIKLGEGVKELGGLLVLGTERHESRRIDRQLRGRCARQGDPGASRFYVSLEDDLMRLFANQGALSKMLEKSFGDDEVLEHGTLDWSIQMPKRRWSNKTIRFANDCSNTMTYSIVREKSSIPFAMTYFWRKTPARFFSSSSKRKLTKGSPAFRPPSSRLRKSRRCLIWNHLFLLGERHLSFVGATR